MDDLDNQKTQDVGFPTWESIKTKRQRQKEWLIKAALYCCGAGILVMGFSMLIEALLTEVYEMSKKSKDVVEESVSTGAEFHQMNTTKRSEIEDFAREFITEPDVERRLSMARAPEQVRPHLSSYPEEALKELGLELRHIGTKIATGTTKSSFSVGFTNGRSRLLNVLGSKDGLKVDWDSYARYCSVNWQELTSKESAESALVRVFVRPGNYYVGDYIDSKKWVCFRLETPDTQSVLFAYGRVGELATIKTQRAVLSSSNYRQHMILRVVAKGPFADDAFFELKEMVAVGWVKQY